MNRIYWKIGVSELEGNRIIHEAVSEAREHGSLKLENEVFRFAFNIDAENGSCAFHAESSQLAHGRFFLAAELPDCGTKRENSVAAERFFCRSGNMKQFS